jgi:D-alanyl-D-alanine carboxypeptidase
LQPADLQRLVDELVTELALPGAVLSVGGEGERPMTVAAGFADIEVKTPMSPQNRLLGASIGKSFVAALCVRLAELGVLDLDAPVSRWVGSQPWFPGLANAPLLTVRRLLSHSAGIEDHVYQPGYLERRTRADDPDWIFPHEDKVALVSGRPALFAPGQGFRYTDTAYIIAGLVLDAAAGRPYYEMLQELFLRPLGLTLTAPSDRRVLEGLAAGYMSENDPFARSGMPRKVMEGGALRYNPGVEWTGGGLVTNPRDLVLWANALYSGRLLGEAGLRQVLTPGFDGPLTSAWTHYGLGAMIFEGDGGVLYGHWGNMPGYSGLMAYSPDLKVAFALQANCTVFPTKSAQDRIFASLRG